MAWNEHIHVHVHNDNSEVVALLKEIRDLLKPKDDQELIQVIMDKLDKLLADIKSTV